MIIGSRVLLLIIIDLPRHSRANRLRTVLHIVLVLGKHSEQELALFVGIERRRHDAVGARRQLEAAGHLAQVDEGRRTRHRRVILEELEV